MQQGKPNSNVRAGAVPRLSVVLPVRNGAQYVRLAIDSILRQTFGDFELIIIDDGSTDGTPSILREAAASDRRVRIVEAPHRGISAAMNFAIAEARGEYIARADHDDISRPTRFERQISYLDANPDIALVGTWADVIDARGSPTDQRRQFPTRPQSLFKELRRGQNRIIHSSVMMRRDCVVGVGGYRQAANTAEDLDLWLRLAERHPLANMPEYLMSSRTHGRQVSVVQAARQRLMADLCVLAFQRRAAGLADPFDSLPADADLIAGPLPAKDKLGPATATVRFHRLLETVTPADPAARGRDIDEITPSDLNWLAANLIRQPSPAIGKQRRLRAALAIVAIAGSRRRITELLLALRAAIVLVCAGLWTNIASAMRVET